jgi:ATP-binding protein involved in chromosome partitioning
MTDAPDRSAVLSALDRIVDPKSGKGLVQAGLVQGLAVGPGRAGFMLEVERSDAALYAPVREAAEAALKAVPGVTSAQVVLTTAATGPSGPSPARGARLSDAAVRDTRPPAPVPVGRPPHVKAVIAVASGKGGVGKSTVSVNLACALARLGLNVGLLDADVYGPSAPIMLGVGGAPDYGPEKKMTPKRAHGIRAMSIGLLVDAEQAMVWRGPMASQAITQMLNETLWGTAEEPLDVLVVDLPPGTGDVQLTLVQKTKLDGAVVVSTPQEVALADARRAVAMFGKTGTPVLGLVENMAYLVSPDGGLIDIFGRGGAAAEAARLGLPLLGELPLDPALRIGGDTGRPLVADAPESPTALMFLELAKAVRDRLPAE